MHDPHPPFHQPVLDNPLFRVRNLSYRYPDDTEALTGVRLDIAVGDRIALVGQNGSGKTTLMKHLCGLLMPSTGEVRFKGEALKGRCLEGARLKIGLLFQDPDDQLFGHTLLDDVSFGPRHQGMSKQEAEEAALQALQHVSLADKAYKAPHNLSFGQKKRAALAGLLAMEPEVLLLDEPTTNLDPSQEQVFLDLLKDYSGTLICISHDLIFLYDLCHRAVVMGNGTIQHDYTVRDLVSQRSALKTHGLDFSFRLVADPEMEYPSHSHGAEGGGHRHRENGLANPPHNATPHKNNHPLPPFPDTFGGSISCPGGVSEKPPLVTMEDYHYRYPDNTPALEGINLTIHGGERISIVGENGAGKTTLLSCLLGLREGCGKFLFDGKPLSRRRHRRLWQKVGMVFQDCADQLFCASVREEITFGLRQLGHSRAESARRLAKALAMVHLEGFEDRVPLHMSGGERKRLALACVLAMEPELIILDEPTAGLDPRGEELLLKILRDLDVTLLLVSHDMFFVRALTCRTLVMHQGRVIEDLPIDDFMQDERLGNLNGLSYAYRQRCTHAIRMLQHEHEHNHLHFHLHSHTHRHGDVVHDHFHEHAHEHTHKYLHRHPGDGKTHRHAPRKYHDHDHPGHEAEEHSHGHDEEVNATLASADSSGNPYCP